MPREFRDYIEITNAYENNLKNISVRIPKKAVTVFTGVSGSGKSSLCLDTIAAESRRELNETFPSFVQQFLPKYGRPEVERIANLPVTIVIDQKKPAANTRSTVGTYTDIYSILRLLFSRVGRPFIGYSDTFSFNHPAGKCPSLWRWKRYAYSGLFDLDKKIKDYSPEELELFLHSPQIRLKNPPSNWPKSAKFEGIFPRMYRSIINTKEGARFKHILDNMVTTFTCPDCGGSRVNERVRSCLINGKNIADVTAMPVPEALEFVNSITDPMAADIKRELGRRLGALVQIGLGYLSLSRGTGTLSGGEAQRIKIAKYINSALTDMAYVLDEPSVGLHAKDIDLLKKSLRALRDHGNTVLIVEHHREVVKLADHVVDMGPGAGNNGGEVVFEGSYDELLKSDTITGRMLQMKSPFKAALREPKGWFRVGPTSLHNLKDVSVELPLGVMTVIAGVAGSGKSSLMESFQNQIKEDVIFIGQKNIGINLRSTPATYLGVADDIRAIFAAENKVSSAWFSFNSKGACPACGGSGVIVSGMAFMDSIETVCDLCGGKRYSKEALAYTYKGKNIAEVMDMTVDEAAEFFAGRPLCEKLTSLRRTGLGYLHLNQSMTTLSGGELQRVKLASHLNERGSIFILDEPTDGLHLDDIKTLMKLFNELTDAGNTLFLVEHSVDVMKEADYIVELGPGGGNSGGEIIFAGLPRDMLSCEKSVTRPYLAESLPASEARA